MIFHLGFKGAFSDFLGELLEQAALTEDIFRAVAAHQQLVYGLSVMGILLSFQQVGQNATYTDFFTLSARKENRLHLRPLV